MLNQFLSFALVGAGGFVVDVLIVYTMIFVIGLSPLTARIPSFLAAATFTWYFNRRLTFNDCDRSQPLSQWVRFLVVNAGGGVVNFATYAATLWLLGDAAVVPLLAVAAGSLTGLSVNYIASRYLVFQTRAR